MLNVRNPPADTRISSGFMREAGAIAQRISEVMEQRGLPPAFSDWLITEDQGLTWLFGVLDTRKVGKLEHYLNPGLLHHLSTSIGGRPIYLSNSSGIRYGILLTAHHRLPGRIDFPGGRRDAVLLGQIFNRTPLQLRWENLGHMLVAGMTGSGKSSFLRLIACQALYAGHRLLLADMDQRTFPMLSRHPALLAPIATTPSEVREVIDRALLECDRRARIYERVPGFPDSLEEYNATARREDAPVLERLMVILDEYTVAAQAAGGARGALAGAAAELGWRGRKFGIHLIFSAQDFTKALVGRVRDQVNAVVCFRVRSAAVARIVGVPDAVRIPAQRPGRACTDRWGPMQSYYLDKAEIVAAGKRTARKFSTE